MHFLPPHCNHKITTCPYIFVKYARRHTYMRVHLHKFVKFARAHCDASYEHALPAATLKSQTTPHHEEKFSYLHDRLHGTQRYAEPCTKRIQSNVVAHLFYAEQGKRTHFCPRIAITRLQHTLTFLINTRVGTHTCEYIRTNLLNLHAHIGMIHTNTLYPLQH